MHLWDRSGGTLLWSCNAHSDQVLSLRFSSIGGEVVNGSADETPRLRERARLLRQLAQFVPPGAGRVQARTHPQPA